MRCFLLGAVLHVEEDSKNVLKKNQRGDRSPQVPPLHPPLGSGTPRDPVIDEQQNGKASINAFVFERTPAECEG